MKMNNFLKYIAAGATAVTMLASCEMELVPSTSIAYEEGKPLFLTANDVQSFQNGVMISYRSLHYGVYYNTSEVMGSSFNAALDFGNNYGPVHRTDATFTTSDYDTEDMWVNHYSAIKNYNIAIANADQVTDDLKAAAQTLKGIALFCRASSYITLTRHFGVAYNASTAATDLSVPLVTVYDQLKKAERATVKQVYDQIIADLNEAETLLAANPGSVRAQLPTVDAVKALKARYYIDVKDYENAAKYAEEVINSAAGYALASTEEEMVAEYTNDSGNEPILQLYASQSEGTVACTIYTSVGNDSNVGKYFSPYFLPSKYLLDSYATTDLRYKSWFTNTLYPVRMSGSFHNGVTVFTKYLDNPALRSGTIETGAHACKPLLISEMYLIAAEANLNVDVEKAKTILNALQSKRSATPTEATLENVKKEWLKETVGEGLYFTCAKRWGDGFPERPGQAEAESLGILMTGAGYQTRTLAADSHIFNWPIPAYEIQLNKDLQQNDGYTVK